MLRQITGDEPQPTLIRELFGQTFGCVQIFKKALELSERVKGSPEVETEIDRRRTGMLSVGETLQGGQRLLKPHDGFTVSRPAERLPSCLSKIRDGLLPPLAAKRVISQPLDVLSQSWRVECLDSIGDACMHRPSAFMEHARV